MLIKKLQSIVLLMGMILVISISAYGQNANQAAQIAYVEKVISLIQTNYMNPFNANLDQLYGQLRKIQAQCENCTLGQLENKLSKAIKTIGDFHFRLVPSEWNEEDDFGPVGNLQFYGGRYGFNLVKASGVLIVSHVHAGTPAGRAGLIKGDVIFSVNDTRGSAEQLEKIIRQAEVFYRSVELKILSVDGKEKIVKMFASDNDGAFTALVLQPEVAIITMTQFDYGTADKWFHKTLAELKFKGIKKLIVDVRYSNGGEPFAVVNIVGAFLPKIGQRYLDKAGVKISYHYEKGMISYQKDDAGKITDETEAFENPANFDGPVVVLISGFSVSGAEVFADMMQAAKRATLVGEVTAGGTGVLANFFTLSDGTTLALTTHRTFDWDNKPMNLIAKPDVPLSLDGNLLKLGRDNQIERAVEILNSK